ncbi:hypothetical protein ACWGGS_01760 [Streptomyces decoyicus]
MTGGKGPRDEPLRAVRSSLRREARDLDGLEKHRVAQVEEHLRLARTAMDSEPPASAARQVAAEAVSAGEELLRQVSRLAADRREALAQAMHDLDALIGDDRPAGCSHRG